jgi:hypothetical protein
VTKDVPERAPLALDRGVQQEHASDRRKGVFVGDIDAAGACYPAQLRVKDQQSIRPSQKMGIE